MSLENCVEHNLQKEYICAKNTCNLLICLECFKTHGQQLRHPFAVKLSIDSKQFFLRWTEFVLKKLVQFSSIVANMGYSKIFQMKLELNHPKGTVSQLNFQQIEKIIIQALQQHKKTTGGNLTYINSTKSITEMVHPQFLKDLFNIATEDAKFNLQNLPATIQRKLIQAFPTKQIYKFSKFHVSPKQIIQIQEQRRRLIKQFEDRVLYRIPGMKDSPKKSPSSTNRIHSPRKMQDQGLHGSINSTLDNFQGPLSSPRNSNKQPILTIQNKSHSNMQVQTNRIQSPRNITSPRQITSPSLRNLESSISNVSNLAVSSSTSKVFVQTPLRTSTKTIEALGDFNTQQLKTTIALLKSNQSLYQHKINNFQTENTTLKQRIQSLKLAVNNRNAQNFQVSTEERTLRSSLEVVQSHNRSLQQENKLLRQSFERLQQKQNMKSSQFQALIKENNGLKEGLILKEKSISMLNKLISNSSEEIQYRQNQVEILSDEIKKLMQKIKTLQLSIHTLNNYISNEDEEISYREKQVSTLHQEVQKMVKKNKQLQKSIAQLNKLIINQEECISYRQSQCENLSESIQKLLATNKQLQQRLKSSQHTTKSTISQASSIKLTPDMELIEQVVLLQADLQIKSDDIKLLLEVAQNYIDTLAKDHTKQLQTAQVYNKLQSLRTIQFIKSN